VGTDRLFGSMQLETSRMVAGIANRVVVGADVLVGRLDTEYRGIVLGGEDAFAESTGEPGEVEARGRGRRAGVAAFASLEIVPVSPLRVTLGGRLDRIADRFEPRGPSDGETVEATRTAFSPRLGANLRWLDGARQTGNVYASVARSFKAPTMDQLFDQRTVPIPVEPFAVTTSNADLESQYGTSVEAGAYHRVAFGARATARLSASVYQMDMTNELDFDLEQFRYVNLGRSRHRGLEAGATLEGPSATSAFVSVTRQYATSRRGEHEGNQLKAVPRDVLGAGVARTPTRGLGLGASVTRVGGAFYDDANARPIPAFTRVDARASHSFGAVLVAVNVRNLGGARYVTTGFPDPGGSDALLLYPAAGRVVTIGLESRR